ncbi:MAG: hypothetical protein ACREXY_15605, partial [Gammaproteobacteria bacterium]
MAREPSKWFDRCVRLEGYVSGYRFFSGPKGMYREAASDAEDHKNDGWLGLYFEEREEIKKPSGRISLIGRVDDCNRAYERGSKGAASGTIIMMMGYCHYQGGLTLTRVRVLSRSAEDSKRQTGEEARKAFGDLERPDSAHPVPENVRKMVERFEHSFAVRDRRQLSELATPYLMNVDTSEEKRSYE